MSKCWLFGHKGFKIGHQYVPGLFYDGVKQVERDVHWCKRCGVVYYKSILGDYKTIHEESYDWKPTLKHIMERNNQQLRSIKIHNIWKQNK